MTSAFFFLLIGRYSNSRAVLLAIAFGYTFISFYTLAGRRWAIVVSIIAAILLMVRWLPMVAVNIWMFITGHPLYQDSPGTIFIVAIYAVIFAIPSTLLCGLYLAQRRTVWKLLRHSRLG